MTDEDLRLLAMYESAGLTTEARHALIGELARRGLEPAVVSATTVDSLDDGGELVEIVRGAACPYCGSVSAPLNAATVMDMTGLFFVAFESVRSLVVACPHCIKRAAASASMHSLLAGWWWAFGVLGVPYVLLGNLVAALRCRRREPSPALRAFVWARAAALRGAASDPTLVDEVLCSMCEPRLQLRLLKRSS